MKLFIIITVLFATCSCEIDFSSRSRNFSIELVHFTQLQKDGHVVISPFGIWSLMTGVALGTSGNSYAELSRTFLLPKNENTLVTGYNDLVRTVLDTKSNGVTLTSKNFLFLADDFQISPYFQRTITIDFGAKLKVLNFHDPDLAARVANNYIQSAGGKVSNVLQSDDFAQSRMILTNVISFKGSWSTPFNKSNTNIEPFYDENRRVIGQVNMMYQRAGLPFSNIKELKAFALELPYESNNKYSMLVLLPYASGKVNDVYKKLATFSLKSVFDKLQADMDDYGAEDIDIKLPRFQISTNVVLNKPLNDMGVYDIFEPEYANFAKVTKEKIFVSAIVHKAEIEVTETGTIATATSTANFADRKTTPMFQVNKPFIYFVMEKSTTTMIFGGIYSKPSVF